MIASIHGILLPWGTPISPFKWNCLPLNTQKKKKYTKFLSPSSFSSRPKQKEACLNHRSLLHTYEMRNCSPVWSENNPSLHEMNCLFILEVYDSIIWFSKCTLYSWEQKQDCWPTELSKWKALSVTKKFGTERWPAIPVCSAHLCTSGWISRQGLMNRWRV